MKRGITFSWLIILSWAVADIYYTSLENRQILNLKRYILQKLKAGKYTR